MLTVYTLEQTQQWDDIVRSFAAYDVYWLSGYVKAFQIHGDGTPLMLYYHGRSTRGINVVMKRDIAKDERFSGKLAEGMLFDLITPYGYGGWIIEGEDTEALFEAYCVWVASNNIISEFVRFHPMVKTHEKCSGFYDVIELGSVVHINLTTPEDIWNNFTSRNRNMIRKAIKNNIRIYNGRFPWIYEEFRTLYNSTMERDDADSYYFFEPEFYSSILEDLPQNAQVFWAEKDNKVIAASIMLTANGRMNYHLSGSVKEFSSLAPNNLLLYTAALWGVANEYETLYLGGGVGSGEDNLFKFKRSFNKGDLNHFHIGTRIFNMDRYTELVNMRGQIVDGYFPKYRAKEL